MSQGALSLRSTTRFHGPRHINSPNGNTFLLGLIAPEQMQTPRTGIEYIFNKNVNQLAGRKMGAWNLKLNFDKVC